MLEAVAGIFSLLAAAVEAKLTSGKAFFKQLDGKEQARKVIAKQLEELLRTWLLDVLYVKPPDSKAEGLLPDLLECAQAQLRELAIVTSSHFILNFILTSFSLHSHFILNFTITFHCAQAQLRELASPGSWDGSSLESAVKEFAGKLEAAAAESLATR